MIHKKRGQGMGKWNVPGGKIQNGESEVDAAVRETREESGIVPCNPQLAGRLEFRFPAGNSWDNDCAVYRTEEFSGKLLEETEECRAFWMRMDGIPMDKLWDSDRLWLPLLLKGEYFHRKYVFDAQDLVREETDLLHGHP